MPDLIGAPSLVGSPALTGEPDLLGAPSLLTPKFLFGRKTPYIPEAVSGFSPPSDFGFTVATLQGEIARMWVEVSGVEALFDLRTGSPSGTVYQATPMVPGGPQINRLRVFSAGASMRFHATGPFLSTWAQNNDGGTGEPDLSFHFYTSASTNVERRLQDRSGVGGGFLNFVNNTGVLANFFAGLLVDGAKVLIVLADAA